MLSMGDISNRPMKAEVRKLAVCNYRDTPRKAALMMPSKELACVKLGFELGTFDKRTDFIFVERERAFISDMMKNVSDNWDNFGSFPYIFANELEHLQSIPYSGLDFAFLDFYSNLSLKNLKWIGNTLTDWLRVGADVSFVFQQARRTNRFIDEAKAFFDSDDERRRWVYEHTLRKSCIGNDYLMVNYAMLSAIFGDFDYEDRTPLAEYRDTISMYFVRFSNLRPTSDPLRRKIRHDFIQFMEKYDVDLGVQEGLTPAQKAWETRRRKGGTQWQIEKKPQ